LEIIHSNIKQITIKFYLIDLEVLFSRNPSISLMNNNTEHNEFSYVSPNYIKIIETKENEKIENLTVFDIPNEFYSKNILIEVSSDSIKKFNMYFSSEIKIIISENLGELKVLNQQLKPVIKAYIKVFVKGKNGDTKFYKDGYTDLRGQFNYLDLNTDQFYRPFYLEYPFYSLEANVSLYTQRYIGYDKKCLMENGVLNLENSAFNEEKVDEMNQVITNTLYVNDFTKWFSIVFIVVEIFSCGVLPIDTESNVLWILLWALTNILCHIGMAVPLYID
jgi:hypothetical protein